jgi:hypothetical protein
VGPAALPHITEGRLRNLKGRRLWPAAKSLIVTPILLLGRKESASPALLAIAARSKELVQVSRLGPVGARKVKRGVGAP